MMTTYSDKGVAKDDSGEGGFSHYNDDDVKDYSN